LSCGQVGRVRERFEGLLGVAGRHIVVMCVKLGKDVPKYSKVVLVLMWHMV
jgi:hypothetical protein